VGLTIIPLLTKLDLPHSDPANALEQIERAFGYPEDDAIWTSAKTGEGCEDVLPAIIKRVPPPSDPTLEPDTAALLSKAKFRGKVVDSWYDKYRGTVCLVSLDHGKLEKHDKIVFQASCGQGDSYTIQEVGLLFPQPLPRASLQAGMVGYIVAGLRERSSVQVGDWISDQGSVVEQSVRVELAAAQSKGQVAGASFVNTPKVFASVFPVDSSDFEELQKSMNRLTMNDSGVQVKLETSGALGAGFRCGFLGRLHMEVFQTRLQDEFETEIIATAPSVPYKALMKNGEVVIAENPAQLPEKSDNQVLEYLEPMANVTLLTPLEYMGVMMDIFKVRRARQTELTHLDNAKVIIKYTMPWQEVIIDLHDAVKSASSGFASFDYVEAPEEVSDIVKVRMLINGNPVDALTFVCHRSVAQQRGRAVALKLKNNIKRQQFEVIIQAALGIKPIARERISPVRKDVLIKSGKTVGGGDMTRKQKLLQKQKEGKKRLKSVGNVQLSQKAFLSILERE
jgi:GTP-binding protein LepA